MNMKNNLKSIFAVLLSVFALTSCQKDASLSEADVAKSKIQEKIWLLEYTQVTTSAGIKTKSYIGQTSYYISFYKDGSTNDSDGIIGTYTVEKGTAGLELHVKSKTTGGMDFEYMYPIESVSDKSLVMIKTVNGVENKNFFTPKG
jgi:hypothetical protein